MMKAATVTRLTPVIRALGLGMCFGLFLVFDIPSAHAAEVQQADKKAEPGTAPAGVAAGPVEGFRVHGHWTIEVRDPDGTLAVRRDFENALVIPAGATHLANILGRATTVGGWRINTIGSAHICEASPGGAPSACEIIESTDGLISNAAFPTLTVTVSGAVPAEVVLNGSLVAQLTGNISRVRTFNLYCANTTSPAACPAGTAAGSNMVTDTTLAAPIPVTAGQQVQVRVVISFS